ncbi:hypothetical protein AVEN_268838-1, partial [Araneus ventricosus]
PGEESKSDTIQSDEQDEGGSKQADIKTNKEQIVKPGADAKVGKSGKEGGLRKTESDKKHDHGPKQGGVTDIKKGKEQILRTGADVKAGKPDDSKPGDITKITAGKEQTGKPGADVNAGKPGEDSKSGKTESDKPHELGSKEVGITDLKEQTGRHDEFVKASKPGGKSKSDKMESDKQHEDGSKEGGITNIKSDKEPGAVVKTGKPEMKRMFGERNLKAGILTEKDIKRNFGGKNVPESSKEERDDNDVIQSIKQKELGDERKSMFGKSASEQGSVTEEDMKAFGSTKTNKDFMSTEKRENSEER